MRRAAANDAALICSIRALAIMAQPRTHWNDEEITRAANAFDEKYLLKELENGQEFFIFEEAAFVSCRGDYLAYLFILPEAQKRGLGKKMVGFIEGKIKEAGHNKSWLWAHPYAEDFYIKNGYMPYPETYAPFGLSLRKFEKSL